jgi:glutamate/aspartate transport system substrate-binding protein
VTPRARAIFPSPSLRGGVRGGAGAASANSGAIHLRFWRAPPPAPPREEPGEETRGGGFGGLAVLACALTLFATTPALAEDLGGADLTAPPVTSAEALPATLSGTLAKVRASGIITLGYRDASFPFSYVRPGSPEPLGYSVDLCKGVAAEVTRELQGAPVRIAYEPVTSDTRIEAVTSGKIDIECGSTTDNVEREKTVAFSPLIFVAGTKLLARRGGPIRSFRDLTGKTLVVTSGTTNEKAMRALNDKYKLGILIVAAPDHDASYEMLASGKADAFATDDVLLNGFISSRNAGATMEVVGDYLTYEPYGLMFRKDDPEMSEAVRRAFAAMASDGELVANYHKWFLGPTPTGENINLPMSLQLTEALRAMGVDEF